MGNVLTPDDYVKRVSFRVKIELYDPSRTKQGDEGLLLRHEFESIVLSDALTLLERRYGSTFMDALELVSPKLFFGEGT